jgi:hypothetical protein
VGLSIPQVRLLSYGFALLAVASFVVFHTRYRLISLFVPLLLLGTNPLFTYYSATIRPYAMMVALASLVTLSALLLRERGSASSRLEVQGDLPIIRGIFYGTGLLLGLTHYYGTLYVAILLAIDAVERRISRSRLPGIGLFSLLLLWPLFQKLFGSLEKQAESNQWVEVLPFVSTFNNSHGEFPRYSGLSSACLSVCHRGVRSPGRCRMAIASKPSRRRFPVIAATVQSFVLEAARVPGSHLDPAPP